MRKLMLSSLLLPSLTERAPKPDESSLKELADLVHAAAKRRLGRSLSIRHVDAGSCNGCELEIHALSNAFYDLERFGFHFVASPRHADVLLVTGPVTKNMQEALVRTFDATPEPKWVVAVGDCAVNGGLFAASYAVVGGVGDTLPVDLHIRGCPPSPSQLLGGLLALMTQRVFPRKASRMHGHKPPRRTASFTKSGLRLADNFDDMAVMIDRKMRVCSPSQPVAAAGKENGHPNN